MELTNTQILLAAAPLVLLAVEYYLGKTEVPKANSIIEMLLNVFKIFKR